MGKKPVQDTFILLLETIINRSPFEGVLFEKKILWPLIRPLLSGHQGWKSVAVSEYAEGTPGFMGHIPRLLVLYYEEKTQQVMPSSCSIDTRQTAFSRFQFMQKVLFQTLLQLLS